MVFYWHIVGLGRLPSTLLGISFHFGFVSQLYGHFWKLCRTFLFLFNRCIWFMSLLAMVIYKSPPLFKLMFLKSPQLFQPPDWNVILEFFDLTIQQATRSHVFVHCSTFKSHTWLVDNGGGGCCIIAQVRGGPLSAVTQPTKWGFPPLPPTTTLFRMSQAGVFGLNKSRYSRCWWCISIKSRKWYNSRCCVPFFQFPDRCNTQRQKAGKVKAKDYGRF